jgi:hypothetical protein
VNVRQRKRRQSRRATHAAETRTVDRPRVILDLDSYTRVEDAHILSRMFQCAWEVEERRVSVHEVGGNGCAPRSEGVEIVRTPIRAPKANAIAKRFVGAVRRECLDWLLIVHRRHLERVLRVFVDHYNSHLPRRALGLAAPVSARPALRLVTPPPVALIPDAVAAQQDSAEDRVRGCAASARAWLGSPGRSRTS